MKALWGILITAASVVVILARAALDERLRRQRARRRSMECPNRCRDTHHHVRVLR